MADTLLSPKTFFRDLLVNFIAGLAGGAVVGMFSGMLWLGLLSFSAIVVVVFFFWLWGKYSRAIKFVLSGSSGYYYSFDLEENPRIWKEARHSFCYLGISSDSILELFRRWVEKHPITSYKVLLMKPESESLRRQAAYQKGHPIDIKLETLSPEAEQAIADAAAATSERIRGAVCILKQMMIYKEDRLKIKYYDSFTPWWMYVLDSRKAYVGILEKGKRGIESPVMIMRKNDAYTNPFDAFKNYWEALWEDATDA